MLKTTGKKQGTKMRKGQKLSEESKKKLSKAIKKKIRDDPVYKKKITKTSFKKGNVPWNKGLKGIHMSPATEFKKGELTREKHPSWKGGIHIPKKDCVQILTKTKKKRRPHIIWKETHKTKVPKGHVVYHKDGNRYNDDPDNLILITRAELLKINREKYLARRR